MDLLVFNKSIKPASLREMSNKIKMHSQKKSYDYSDPLDVWHLVLGDQVIADLIKTRAFQRLRKISFLGGIDYTLVKSPNKSKFRYTRYQHSLGVSRLSFIYAQINELSYDDRRLACISALLHDIGHAPLSHSLEDVFIKYFDINHHIATNDIITGKNAIGTEVYNILRWYNINIERVVSIINGDDYSFDGFFSGPINFDTIEGILRTYAYVKDEAVVLKPDRVVRAATLRGSDINRQAVDEFWIYKDIVYNTIINSNIGIISDHICRQFMKRKIYSFSREDYFTSEHHVFKKLPGLKRLLTSQNFASLTYDAVEYPILYNRRRFFIDPNYKFDDRIDKQRYRQTKTRSLLDKSELQQPVESDFSRSFFDGDPI